MNNPEAPETPNDPPPVEEPVSGAPDTVPSDAPPGADAAPPEADAAPEAEAPADGQAEAKPRDEVTIRLFGRTDVGQVREHNEDNFIVADLTRESRGLMESDRNQAVGD